MKYFLILITIYSLLLTNLAYALGGTGAIQADKINPSVSGNPVQIPNVQVDNVNIDGNTVKSTSSDLIIDSANKIKPNKDIEPNSSGLNIGSSSVPFNNIYANGQYVGMRIENVLSTSMPASSSATKGRVVFATDTKKFYIDDGSNFILASGSGGISSWITATTYSVDSIVHINNKIYKCIVAHTSGTFATDLTASKWIELAADPSTEILTGYSAGAGTVSSTDSVKSAIQKIDGNVSSLSSSTTTSLSTKIDKSTVTAKGDLIVASAASTPSKLSVGSDGQVIVADSTQATGIKYADPTIKVKADNGTGTSTKTLTVPDASIVTDSANGYILDLSGSLAIDPSFESADPVTNAGWVITNAGTPSTSTTYRDNRKQSLYIPANASGNGATAVLDVSTNAAGLKGQQGVIAISVRRDNVAPTSTVTVCARIDGVTSTSNCLIVPPLDTNNPFKRVILPVTMGGTSTGVSIKATGFEGYYLDSLNISQGFPIQNVSGATFIGSCTSTLGSNQTSSNTSYTTLSAASSLTTAVTGSGVQPSTNTAGCKFSTLSAGRYLVIWDGGFGNSTNTASSLFSISDGTTQANEEALCVGNAGYGCTSITANFTYATTQSNITFVPVAKAITNSSVVLSSVKQTFKVYYYPPDSKIYSQASQDYDWTLFTPTSPNSSITFSGAGCFKKRKGSDLYIRCNNTVGAGGSSGSEAQMALPDSLTTASTYTAQTIVGNVAYGTSGALAIYATVKPSVGYINFGNQSSGTNAMANITGSSLSSGSAQSWQIGPIAISGWQDYGVIVGSFAGIEKCANDYECTDTFSAQVTTTTGAITSQNIPWLASCTAANPSVCTLNTNLKDGVNGLSSPMNCTATAQSSGGTITATIASPSSTGFNVVSSAGSTGVWVKCQKGTNDYKPKTAKVASSIGVPTVPGLTTSGTGNSVDTFSFTYYTTVLGTPCSATPCTLKQIGNAVASMPRTGSGNYTVNFNKTYTNVICTSASSNRSLPDLTCSNCNSISFTTSNFTPSVVDTAGSYMCQGSY